MSWRDSVVRFGRSKYITLLRKFGDITGEVKLSLSTCACDFFWAIRPMPTDLESNPIGGRCGRQFTLTRTDPYGDRGAERELKLWRARAERREDHAE